MPPPCGTVKQNFTDGLGNVLSLRSYQRDALNNLYDYFVENAGNPLISVPTGGGKSLICATLMRESLAWWPDTRILYVTHVRELIKQAYSELMAIWPEAPAGLHSAGLKARDTLSPIIFGGIQSLYKHAHKLPAIDLVIIDEAHLAGRRSDSMYRSFLADLHRYNPMMKIIGLTATPFRLESGYLHEGDDRLFTDLVYEANVKDLINEGYLSPPVSASGVAQVDTAGVGLRGGEFIPAQLEAAALDVDTISRICEEINKFGRERKGWLVFACGVKHAKLLCDELRNFGVRAECAFGETPSEERNRIIEGFKKQEIKALVTVGILTTGFNAKHVDLLAVVRPTKSTGLWIQMVGRGLRLSPGTGKQNCLILDFGSNLARHGPIDDPIVHTPSKRQDDEPNEAPTKLCPECGAENPIAAVYCSNCLTVFPSAQRMVETKASKLAVLSNHDPEWVPVESVGYHRHTKQDKPDSLCVTYRSGLAQYRTWVCLEHFGYPRQRAEKWWKKMCPEVPPPLTVSEALELREYIQEPREIAVKRAGKYFEIVGERL
jgi:DNA repair protein RadD